MHVPRLNDEHTIARASSTAYALTTRIFIHHAFSHVQFNVECAVIECHHIKDISRLHATATAVLVLPMYN